MSGPSNTTPRGPSPLLPRSRKPVSERGMFSLLMMMGSLSALGIEALP